MKYSSVVKVVASARLLPNGSRHRLDHSGQMKIEEAPQPDQVRPGSGVIALRRHPRLLFVTRKNEVVHELGADEALMVGRGGIDEVADDLLRTPFARSGRPVRFRFRKGEQPGRESGDGLTKIRFDRVHARSLSIRRLPALRVRHCTLKRQRTVSVPASPNSPFNDTTSSPD